MNTVKVSPKFQVVIPEKIRKEMGIKAGECFEVIEYEGCLEFVPIRGIRSLKRIPKGMATKAVREKVDRL